jgi:hypothetical protein
MTTITAGTSLGSGLVYDSDTTGNLVIKTGNSASIAATFHGNAATTFNGNIHVGNVRLGATDFYGSKSTNGWQQLPGGLIIQWGYYAGGAHGPTITFPIVFPTAVLNLSATAAVDNSAIAVAPSTTSSFSATQLEAASNSNNSAAFYWLAIGY